MERIGALFTGAPIDRPPFTLTLSLYGARLTGCSCASYYSNPDAYAEGQRAVVELCSPDIVFSPFALALEAAAYGAMLDFPEDGPPYLKKPAYKSIHGLVVPRPHSISSSPHLSYLIKAAEKVVADQNGARPVAAPIVAPVDLPILLLGLETWLDMLLFKPDEARLWGQLALDHFISLSKAYSDAGINFVVTPVMLANPLIVNPDIARRTLLPVLSDAFAHARLPIVFHHGGNKLGQSLGMFRDLPNLLGFVLDERDSLVEARQQVGPDLLLLGNLNGPSIPYRSVDDIKRRTISILLDRNGDPKFIFASAGADIPYGTGKEKLVALRDLLSGDPGSLP